MVITWPLHESANFMIDNSRRQGRREARERRELVQQPESVSVHGPSSSSKQQQEESRQQAGSKRQEAASSSSKQQQISSK